MVLEVWYPGLVKTISAAVKEKVTNLVPIEADAVQAMPIIIPKNSCAQVWTFSLISSKKRHHKRRIIQPLFVEIVASCLQEEGVWRTATDWNDYAWHIRDVIEESEYFNLIYIKGRIVIYWMNKPERGGFVTLGRRVMTRFEQRGIEVEAFMILLLKRIKPSI